MAKLYSIDSQMPPKDVMEHSAQVLAKGGLVVFPTETFYGIAADSQNPEGLEKLANLKGRDAEKPFPLIISSVEQLDPLVGRFSNFVQKFMDTHWPGPLTLVMEAKAGAHPRLLSNNNGIAARLSSWPCAAALSNSLGRAITATSANLAGGAPAQTMDQLDPAVASAVDIILDGGPTPGGQASTVLDVRVDPPLVLRQGPVHIPEAAR